MKFFATLAIAAAIRLNSDNSEDNKAPKLTAAKIFKECNTDGDNDLDYKEVVTCMNANNVTKQDQKAAGNVMLKYAYIPKTNFDAVAEGVSAFTGGKVSEADVRKEIDVCNTNGDNKLVYKEVKKCLVKNAKALGLTSKKRWNAAKWGLARAAVINKKGLKKALA